MFKFPIKGNSGGTSGVKRRAVVVDDNGNNDDDDEQRKGFYSRKLFDRPTISPTSFQSFSSLPPSLHSSSLPAAAAATTAVLVSSPSPLTPPSTTTTVTPLTANSVAAALLEQMREKRTYTENWINSIGRGEGGREEGDDANIDDNIVDKNKNVEEEEEEELKKNNYTKQKNDIKDISVAAAVSAATTTISGGGVGGGGDDCKNEDEIIRRRKQRKIRILYGDNSMSRSNGLTTLSRSRSRSRSRGRNVVVRRRLIKRSSLQQRSSVGSSGNNIKTKLSKESSSLQNNSSNSRRYNRFNGIITRVYRTFRLPIHLSYNALIVYYILHSLGLDPLKIINDYTMTSGGGGGGSGSSIATLIGATTDGIASIITRVGIARATSSIFTRCRNFIQYLTSSLSPTSMLYPITDTGASVAAAAAATTVNPPPPSRLYPFLNDIAAVDTNLIPSSEINVNSIFTDLLEKRLKEITIAAASTATTSSSNAAAAAAAAAATTTTIEDNDTSNVGGDASTSFTLSKELTKLLLEKSHRALNRNATRMA